MEAMEVSDFWPTLQLRAYSRVAKEILYTFDLEDLKRNFISNNFANPFYSQKVEDLVFIRVVLPPKCQKRLVSVVMILGWEIYKWYECHEKLLHVVDHDLRNKLHWFSFGIIDRLRTARNFIQDVNWNIQQRFHLACKYYFEDDAKILWKNMSTADQSYIKEQLPRTIEIWLQTLSRNIPLDWREIPERRNFFPLNILGMRSYFANLRGSQSRYLCISYALRSRMGHHFDLHSCLCQINANELNDVLTNLPWTELSELFKIFLQWPFQTMFLDAVTNFQEHIDGFIFHDLVKFILYDKLGKGWEDYTYVVLLNGLWNLFSSKYEKPIKMDKELYKLLKCALQNIENFNTSYLEHLMKRIHVQ